MKAILEQIVNVAFLLFGNKLRGYRTYIVSTITMIMSVWSIVVKNLPDLCTSFGFLCRVTDSSWYNTVIVLMTTLAIILKKLDQIEVTEEIVKRHLPK